MRLTDLLYETWAALIANKGRTFLTVLGIVIGIAAVIAMTSLIGGVKDALVSQLGLDQSRVVYISYNSEYAERDLSLSVIEENVSGYEFLAALQFTSETASTDTKQANVEIDGVTSHYFDTMNLTLKQGRLLSDKELSTDAMLVVVDSNFVRTFFGEDEEVVGQSLDIRNDSYQIVGVIESSNSYSTQGTVYMPIQTCALRLTGMDSYSQIIGFAEESVDMDALVADTETFLRELLNVSKEDEDNGYGYIYVQSIESIQRGFDSTMLSFQLLMSAVAGISLLVGGIGIMNMMLTNVTERIREIGLRKALGAHRSDITLQFLFESVAICLVGGFLGFLLGYGGSYLIAGLASDLLGTELTGEALSITPSMSLDTVLLAVGICAGIGIVFGIFPARRAASLDPVESLRHN